MQPLEKSAIDHAERSGYLAALRDQVKSVCLPFWWHGIDQSGRYGILHNGTASLVDTGSRHIAVTADHVLAQYLSDQERDPKVVCQFGSATVNIADRIIDRDPKQDIATIEVSQVVVGPTGSSFHAPREWPPQRLSEGEVIMCAGFPGKLREEQESTAEFPFQWFVGRATNVSSQNISLHLDLDNLHVPLSAESKLNRVLGGMSGGPVFRFVANPIEHLELVGVIYEYHQSYELMLARPAMLFRPDGSIVKEF